MKSLLAFLLRSAAQSATQTANTAFTAGADWKTTGTAALAGALLGTLQGLIAHPALAHPVVDTAVTALGVTLLPPSGTVPATPPVA